MPYSESLAARVRDALTRRRGVIEKKMFGGVCFMVDGNMCVGVWKDSLIARIGEDEATKAFKRSGVSEFDVTGRPMRHWVLIEPGEIDSDAALREWIELALRFVKTLPPK
jgi:TfoX/Sxy family transcriptional regulator of competence genes